MVAFHDFRQEENTCQHTFPDGIISCLFCDLTVRIAGLLQESAKKRRNP
jgi:hypothetical protein